VIFIKWQKIKYKLVNCKLCGQKVKNLRSLSIHLAKSHQIIKKEYYDNFLKKENEGVCYFCGKEAIFKNLTDGYHRICKSKECLGKTRATGTYEFLMYKYDLPKDEAIKLMNIRADERGEKIKNGLQERFENDENFFKEKSINCVEFWFKRGYSQEEAERKVEKVFDIIHEKTSKKRKEHPELYTDVNCTQIKYWIKKGHTNEEAKEKVSQRQSTFSLKICIDKHGEEKGREIWLNRQTKWMENYKKSNFSKISQELYWLIYDSVKENEIYFATLKNGQRDESGNNNEYRLILDTCAIIPDFFIKNKNRIIDFDGDYFHRKGSKAAKGKKERDSAIKRNGYEILHIKEKDFKNNKEKTIQKCINFIKK